MEGFSRTILQSESLLPTADPDLACDPTRETLRGGSISEVLSGQL